MDADTPPPDHQPSASVSRTNRSRISNGALFPAGVDGRSAEARRWRDLYREYAAALGREPSGAEQALLRSLATTTLALELVASQQAQGKPADPAELVALTNSQRRLMQDLGIAPQAPEPPDPLAEHRRRMGWDK